MTDIVRYILKNVDIGYPWDKMAIETVEGWCQYKTWSLMKSMKWGQAVLKCVLQWYSEKEDYEECQKIKLILTNDYTQLMTYEKKLKDKWIDEMTNI